MGEDSRYADEIDLIDIIRVLWKRKKLIIIGTLLLTIAAAGVSLLLPKVYEVTAILEPGTRAITDGKGQIIKETPVESPESIKSVALGGAYDSFIQKKLNISPIDFPKIKIDIPKNTTLIKFIIESAQPEQAVDVLNELLAQISNRIHEKLAVEKKGIENEIKLVRIANRTVEAKIKLIAKQVSETKERIQELEKNRQNSMSSRPADAVSILLYSSELQNKQIYLNGLQEKLKDLESDMQGADIKVDNLSLKLASLKSAIINKEPQVPEKQIKPRKKLIVATMFLFGLLFMNVLALMIEFIGRVKETES
jgi:LPS O-antigen subunit length determinant protein (WzzB/FepE family)